MLLSEYDSRLQPIAATRGNRSFSITSITLHQRLFFVAVLHTSKTSHCRSLPLSCTNTEFSITPDICHEIVDPGLDSEQLHTSLAQLSLPCYVLSQRCNISLISSLLLFLGLPEPSPDSKSSSLLTLSVACLCCTGEL